MVLRALRASILVIAALLVLSAPAAAQFAATVRAVRATVVMEQPRGDSPLITTVPVGSVLTVVDQRGDWFLVDVPVGLQTRRGWVNRQTVQVATQTNSRPAPAPAPPPAPQPGGARSAPAQPVGARPAPTPAGVSPAGLPPAPASQTGPANAVPSRGFVVLNAVYQFAANDFADGATKRENAEDGRFDTAYVVKGGPAFDAAVGAVLWHRLGFAVGVSQFKVSTPGVLTATVPHPFFFNRLRSVNGDVGGLNREELAVHFQLRFVLPIGTRLQVMAFGGPSFFQVKQDMITDYTYNESYPYDDATFRAATITPTTVSKTGFNAGGDVAFFFTRQLGLGATIQFSGTSLDLPGALGSTANVKAGGGQAGGGIRLRF